MLSAKKDIGVTGFERMICDVVHYIMKKAFLDTSKINAFSRVKKLTHFTSDGMLLEEGKDKIPPEATPLVDLERFMNVTRVFCWILIN